MIKGIGERSTVLTRWTLLFCIFGLQFTEYVVPEKVR